MLLRHRNGYARAADTRRGAPDTMPDKTRFAALTSLLVAGLLGCGAKGPPDHDDVQGALDDFFEHQNDRGGVRINLGSAGGFKDIRFDVRLHDAVVHRCTGKDRVYVTNFASSDLYTIDAKSSEVEGEPLRVPTNPFGIAVDGDTIWVSSLPGDQLTKVTDHDG